MSMDADLVSLNRTGCGEITYIEDRNSLANRVELTIKPYYGCTVSPSSVVRSEIEYMHA
jgi:hypothetical protein